MSAAAERTALYRIFGDEDLLLYIGISKRFGKRWDEHAKVQPWWDEHRRMTVDWHASRREAEDAERAAVKAEKPKYNIIYNTAVRPAAQRVLAPAPGPPSWIPVRIPAWERAPVHPSDKWLTIRGGYTITEMFLSDPAAAESIIAKLPEDRREYARKKLELWRLNDKAHRIARKVLRDLCQCERTEDRPEVIAMIRQSKSTVREYLGIPCPCCGGEPPAGMSCQECGTAGTARRPVRRAAGAA